jgi:hypothetical protein
MKHEYCSSALSVFNPWLNLIPEILATDGTRIKHGLRRNAKYEAFELDLRLSDIDE